VRGASVGFDPSCSGEQKFVLSCKRAELHLGEFLLRTAVISEAMALVHWLGQKRHQGWAHGFRCARGRGAP